MGVRGGAITAGAFIVGGGVVGGCRVGFGDAPKFSFQNIYLPNLSRNIAYIAVEYTIFSQ